MFVNDISPSPEQVEQLLKDGDFSSAESVCRYLLAKTPDHLEVLFLLGVCLSRRQDWAGAAESFSHACTVAPGLSMLWNNQAYARQEFGDRSGAIECYKKAISLEEHNPDLWIALASQYVAGYAFDTAAGCYRKALERKPKDPGEVLNRLATLMTYMGDTKNALDIFRQAINCAGSLGNRLIYNQNLLFSMHYPADIGQELIADEHFKWGQQFAVVKYGKFVNTNGPERKIRIGYVSSDFRMNSVCFFIQPVLENHDTTKIKCFCYSNVAKPDHVTEKLSENCRLTWRDITGLDDFQAFSLIQQDGIDILVDLTGHCAGNRLTLFALRPAPIQVTWIGYPDTTGLAAIDYRITDSVADPPGMTEHLHVEHLLRLPGCFLCYNPGHEFPMVVPGPCGDSRTVTFGSMNNFSKITPQLFDVWGEILLRVPGSRLVLRYRGQERDRIAGDFGRLLELKGVAADRLEILGHASSVVEQLGGYEQMDIALDTFPYNGTTTTCEALWMGVPVISLAGRTHVSRVGASLLTTIGLPQFISETTDEYIEKAVALAMNRPLLAALRTRLRDMVIASPLCDHQRFARQLEDVYHAIWARWSAQQKVHSR